MSVDSQRQAIMCVLPALINLLTRTAADKSEYYTLNQVQIKV